MGYNTVDRLRRVDDSHYLLSDKASDRVTYEGRCERFDEPTSKPNWQIKRHAYTNGVWVTTFANDGKYNCVWDDRGTYFPAVVGPDPPADSIPVTGSLGLTGLSVGGLVTEVTLNSTTWTELPAAALHNRNALSIQNSSIVNIKLNYSDTVPGFVGVLLTPGAERMYAITDTILIYAKTESGTHTITVEELA